MNPTTPTASPAYINARNHWADRSLVDRHVYDVTIGSFSDIYQELIVKPFHEWLATQGCRIVRRDAGDKMFGVDSYNVAVGFDVMEFDSEQDQIVFLLKWSGS